MSKPNNAVMFVHALIGGHVQGTGPSQQELSGLIGNTEGVVRVRAGEGSIVVYVSDPKAGNAVKSKYGGAYEDHPITEEKASTPPLCQRD